MVTEYNTAWSTSVKHFIRWRQSSLRQLLSRIVFKCSIHQNNILTNTSGRFTIHYCLQSAILTGAGHMYAKELHSYKCWTDIESQDRGAANWNNSEWHNSRGAQRNVYAGVTYAHHCHFLTYQKASHLQHYANNTLNAICTSQVRLDFKVSGGW